MVTIDPFDAFVADTDAVASEVNTKLETLRAGHNAHDSRLDTLESEVRDETEGGTGQSSYTQGDLLYASSASSLSKLGVGTANQVLTSSGTLPQWATVVYVPVGSIFCFPIDTPPTGYLECNGSSLDTTTYADLFAILGYKYGGSGSNFSLPDLRGQFVRGFDNGAGTDPDAASRTDRGDGTDGDVVGSKQGDQVGEITLSQSNAYPDMGDGSPFNVNVVIPSGSTTVNSGNETRPINISLMYVIKY
jgi:hypothetical protein